MLSYVTALVAPGYSDLFRESKVTHDKPSKDATYERTEKIGGQEVHQVKALVSQH